MLVLQNRSKQIVETSSNTDFSTNNERVKSVRILKPTDVNPGEYPKVIPVKFWYPNSSPFTSFSSFKNVHKSLGIFDKSGLKIVNYIFKTPSFLKQISATSGSDIGLINT